MTWVAAAGKMPADMMTLLSAQARARHQAPTPLPLPREQPTLVSPTQGLDTNAARLFVELGSSEFAKGLHVGLGVDRKTPEKPMSALDKFHKLGTGIFAWAMLFENVVIPLVWFIYLKPHIEWHWI